MKLCHGCRGKGWVDSQYKGAILCPVCGGSGETDGGQAKAPTIMPTVLLEPSNKNPLLFELENWLLQQKGVRFHRSAKTMNAYRFTSNLRRREMGLWVSNYGACRIYLCKGDYTPADPDNRVKYTGVWGGYPQFDVRTPGDVEYATKLILYALGNF